MAYSKKIESSLAFLLMSMTWWSGMMAQSSDCTNEIISMSSCLSYIQGKVSEPSSGCCSQLSSVVSSHPECLCKVLNGGGSSIGLNINQTQALQLPQVCNVQTPPVSQCNNGNTASAPSKSPDTGTGTPGSPSSLPSGRGSNTVPSTNNNSSDASSMKMATPLMFFTLYIASGFIFSS